MIYFAKNVSYPNGQVAEGFLILNKKKKVYIVGTKGLVDIIGLK